MQFGAYHGVFLSSQSRDGTALTYRFVRDDRGWRAIMGDAVKVVVGHAVRVSKPIVIEHLDFTDKKAQLETVDPGRARTLSALAYSQFDAMLRSAAFRAGVHVQDVNPAYTSVMGAVNTAQRRGIRFHLGAANAIARRGLGLSERPIARQGQATVPALRQARTVCATGGSMAGFHHASRQQNCSADATLTDVPF